mmetsp:Transcript_40994/g.72084  ORF Transcript_40994/g.72084 Transcript_40994/m.72084 type:complete len:177 (-) Transcript_40994:132-662(-)
MFCCKGKTLPAEPSAAKAPKAPVTQEDDVTAHLIDQPDEGGTVKEPSAVLATEEPAEVLTESAAPPAEEGPAVLDVISEATEPRSESQAVQPTSGIFQNSSPPTREPSVATSIASVQAAAVEPPAAADGLPDNPQITYMAPDGMSPLPTPTGSTTSMVTPKVVKPQVVRKSKNICC